MSPYIHQIDCAGLLKRFKQILWPRLTPLARHDNLPALFHYILPVFV